jgi:hypothetical protein
MYGEGGRKDNVVCANKWKNWKERIIQEMIKFNFEQTYIIFKLIINSQKRQFKCYG